MWLLDEAHEEVDSEFVLEDVLHVDDEGVLHVEEDVLLELDILVLLVVNNNVLPDAFHCENLLGPAVLYQKHLPKRPLPDHSPNDEVLQLRLFLLPGE